MTEKGKLQIIRFLDKMSENANESWGKPEQSDLHNYWKGQVMGMCKVIEHAKLDIDSEHYLKNLL